MYGILTNSNGHRNLEARERAPHRRAKGSTLRTIHEARTLRKRGGILEDSSSPIFINTIHNARVRQHFDLSAVYISPFVTHPRAGELQSPTAATPSGVMVGWLWTSFLSYCYTVATGTEKSWIMRERARTAVGWQVEIADDIDLGELRFRIDKCTSWPRSMRGQRQCNKGATAPLYI